MSDNELKLPSEWEAEDGIKVHDPDGWRGTFKLSTGVIYHAQNWNVPISREEWDARSSVSSVTGISKR